MATSCEVYCRYKYTIEIFVDHVQAEGQQSDFHPADIVNVRMSRLEKPDTKNYKSVCKFTFGESAFMSHTLFTFVILQSTSAYSGASSVLRGV